MYRRSVLRGGGDGAIRGPEPHGVLVKRTTERLSSDETGAARSARDHIFWAYDLADDHWDILTPTGLTEGAAGGTLTPPMSFQCPLLRKLNMVCTVEKCLKEFHPLLQAYIKR